MGLIELISYEGAGRLENGNRPPVLREVKLKETHVEDALYSLQTLLGIGRAVRFSRKVAVGTRIHVPELKPPQQYSAEVTTSENSAEITLTPIDPQAKSIVTNDRDGIIREHTLMRINGRRNRTFILDADHPYLAIVRVNQGKNEVLYNMSEYFVFSQNLPQNRGEIQ